MAIIGDAGYGRASGCSCFVNAGFRGSDAAPMGSIELVDRDVSAKGHDSGPVEVMDDDGE